ncbi:DUF6062 family protein [Roseburia sp. AM59-24XD]|jgi:hypothetical protein|uniref:DUF6062 family protein n=1 Tax=Roseburia sp. AM59-24XD TaxID=2293138 RepID=UPI000E4C3D73|nr:DUF6062 family protein [Roseburia sp. AM59-24XD]RHP86784.1 hypothetical protein DXA20_05935 [Roseburia sp. AM59-24XD]
MKEQLYTIPVNDAFAVDCECPVCSMYDSLEKDAIEFTMGPSYMEDDIRMETNKIGFCTHHVKQLYKHQNRLGLALILHTHMQRTNRDLEDLLSSDKPVKKGLFAKKTENASPVTEYIENLNQSCYICNRIDRIFARYLATIYHCYEHDEEFRRKFAASKGFCTKHFGMLYEGAPSSLSGKRLPEFIKTLNEVYLTNMKRVTDDLEWFTDKFDYRNEDKPWKNSKDALPRSMNKTNSILPQ